MGAVAAEGRVGQDIQTFGPDFGPAGHAKAVFACRDPAERGDLVDQWRRVERLARQRTERGNTAPDIAENGAVVRLTAGTNLPGVKQLLVLVEKNPFALVAAFQVTEFIEPQFTLNIKMNETSDVYVVAVLANGRALYTKREVRVTLGGCG